MTPKTPAEQHLEVIEDAEHILEDYHRTAPIETFSASHADRRPTELADLRGARLVTANETDEGRRWAESRINMLTGGDPVRARFMRQDLFEFTPAVAKPSFQCSLVYQRHWNPRQIEQAGAQTEAAGRPVDRAVASQRSSSQCADENERRITMHSINLVHAAPINTGAWSMSNTSEPDYTINIIERDGLSIVCEGGIEISAPMDRQKAKW